MYVYILQWVFFPFSLRGVVEEPTNSAETRRSSVTFDKYVHTSKMQPQSSGSLRSNAGAEKGKEIAAKLNIHRIHGQLRGLDTTGNLLRNPNLEMFFLKPLDLYKNWAMYYTICSTKEGACCYLTVWDFPNTLCRCFS